MNIPSELTQALQNNELVLFVGNELSTSAGLPSWVGLVRGLAVEVGARWPSDERDLTSEHVLRVMQRYEKRNGRHRLVQKFRDGLRVGQPAEAHRWLAKQQIAVMFTTNVDDLLERALRAAGKRVNVIVNQTDLAFWSDSEVQVVKLCGDLSRPESLVLTQRDFNTYFRQRPRLAERLRSTLESNTVLFLGYGLQEPFFNQIWDNMGLDFGVYRRRAYAAMCNAEPFTVEALEERDIVVINLRGSLPARALMAWLKRLSAAFDGNQNNQNNQNHIDEEGPLSTDELLSQATCAVMSDGELGTAWLVSQEGYLLTAGHLLGTEAPQEEVEVQFLDEAPQKATRIAWQYDEPSELDFAILKLATPSARRALPLSFPRQVDGPLKICGYGGELTEGQNLVSGTFDGSAHVGHSTRHKIFRFKSASAVEGYSGGAVLSEDLNAVVAIQTKTVQTRLGPEVGTVFALPLYRIAEQWPQLGELAKNLPATAQSLPVREKNKETITSKVASNALSSAPSPPAIPPQLSFSDKMSLVNALLQVRMMSNHNNRQLITAELPTEIKNNISYNPSDKLHVINIVNACLNYAGGIEALHDILRGIEGNSVTMQRFEAAWQRFLSK